MPSVKKRKDRLWIKDFLWKFVIKRIFQLCWLSCWGGKKALKSPAGWCWWWTEVPERVECWTRKQQTKGRAGITVHHQLAAWEGVVVRGSTKPRRQRSDSDHLSEVRVSEDELGGRHESCLWTGGAARGSWGSRVQEVGRAIRQRGRNWPSGALFIRTVSAANRKRMELLAPSQEGS